MDPPAPQSEDELNTEPKTSEKIPPLTTIAPGIFVPIQDAMVTDFAEPPRDRVERLRRILRNIDYQREGIKQNLLYMISREKQRLIQEAAKIDENEVTIDRPRGVSQREADMIIQNMMAPAQPGRDYNIKSEQIPARHLQSRASLPIRERVIEELLDMVESGVRQLANYEVHAAGIKQRYLDILEKELAKLKDEDNREASQA